MITLQTLEWYEVRALHHSITYNANTEMNTDTYPADNEAHYSKCTESVSNDKKTISKFDI